jgi:hypothetical protein
MVFTWLDEKRTDQKLLLESNWSFRGPLLEKFLNFLLILVLGSSKT